MSGVPSERPVHLLAADPEGRAVLLEASPDGTLRLPQLGPIGEFEEHPPIAALLAGYLGAAHPIMRVLPIGGDRGEGATDIAVVAEPLAGPGPDATRWIPLDDPRLDGLRSATALGRHVARWLGELVAGTVDPRRQRWERPGFQGEVSRWMAAQLEVAGTPALGDPTVSQLWAISTMLHVETTGGRVFLKACARVFDAEPAMTETLHRTLPGAVPEVIAIDAAEGWLLMRDAGGVIMGEQPADTWPAAFPALAAIQRATSGGLDGIELEDRGPAALAASLPALLESPFVAAFPDDIGPRFRAAAPRLHDACGALASLPPGPTLMHGDFHPWNALRDGDRVVVIDWSDSAMGHPFMDLTNWFKRVGDPAVRRAMLDVWLDGWVDAAPRPALEEAARLGLVVGALHQVESYRRIVASLEPDADWGLAGGGPGFARWALAWLDDGLEATVPRRAT